ncbi:MAG: hypothetical protein E7655_01135 [Ruminococcaceae bacterium]|nr:hypothetical protein [Oscillospiraceae bacterium]
MKKIVVWLAVISIVVFVVAWGIVGVKILDHNYDFLTEAYIAYGSLAVFFLCLIGLRVTSRCPHCGKPKLFFGAYCPYCGKEVK